MRPWFDGMHDWTDGGDTKVRRCEHEGCLETAEHRAPYSPQQINKYRWFCLEHVKAYNARWDYAKGLSPDEIEQMIRSDTIWNRDTRPLGDWRTKERLLRRQAEMFMGGAPPPRGKPEPAPGYTPQVAAALAMLELDLIPPPDVLQAHYRSLAKKYHPDANGGDKAAEEKLKEINQALAVLKDFLR
jgi:hypothetical protein